MYIFNIYVRGFLNSSHVSGGSNKLDLDLITLVDDIADGIGRFPDNVDPSLIRGAEGKVVDVSIDCQDGERSCFAVSVGARLHNIIRHESQPRYVRLPSHSPRRNRSVQDQEGGCLEPSWAILQLQRSRLTRTQSASRSEAKIRSRGPRLGTHRTPQMLKSEDV